MSGDGVTQEPQTVSGRFVTVGNHEYEVAAPGDDHLWLYADGARVRSSGEPTLDEARNATGESIVKILHKDLQRHVERRVVADLHGHRVVVQGVAGDRVRVVFAGDPAAAETMGLAEHQPGGWWGWVPATALGPWRTFEQKLPRTAPANRSRAVRVSGDFAVVGDHEYEVVGSGEHHLWLRVDDEGGRRIGALAVDERVPLDGWPSVKVPRLSVQRFFERSAEADVEGGDVVVVLSDHDRVWVAVGGPVLAKALGVPGDQHDGWEGWVPATAVGPWRVTERELPIVRGW